MLILGHILNLINVNLLAWQTPILDKTSSITLFATSIDNRKACAEYLRLLNAPQLQNVNEHLREKVSQKDWRE